MAIRAKRISVKDVFKNSEWDIISVIEDDGKYRIEAKRHPLKNQINHFIGYGGREYVEGLAKSHYNKSIHEIAQP